MSSILLNITLIFVVIITLCFYLSDTIEISTSAIDYSFIQIFYNTTQFYASTNIIITIIIIMLTTYTIFEVVTTLR